MIQANIHFVIVQTNAEKDFWQFISDVPSFT